MLQVTSARRRNAGLLILVLSSLIFVVRGLYHESGFLQSRDFKPLYAGARCLLHHENPYDPQALKHEYQGSGGDMADLQPFTPHYTLYLPPAFMLAMPLAVFPWSVAHYLWLLIAAGLMISAGFAVAFLCIPYSPILMPALIGLFLMGGDQLMMLGQPAGPAIGLCVLATALLVREKLPYLAIGCFSLSLTLKPHTGVFIWFYLFLCAEFRKRAAIIAVCTLLICLPAVGWVSVNPSSAGWVQELRVNLKATEAVGGLSDPGPRNLEAYYITTLQTVVSLVRDDRAFYNHVSWLICGVLLALWAAAVALTRPSYARHMFAIAAITSLSMLPIYHRAYDTKILLLCFPAIALVLDRAFRPHEVPMQVSGRSVAKLRARAGWVFLGFILIVFAENDRYSPRLYHLMSRPDPEHLLRSILYLRSVTVVLLLQTILYTCLVFWFDRRNVQRSWDRQPQPDSMEKPGALLID